MAPPEVCNRLQHRPGRIGTLCLQYLLAVLLLMPFINGYSATDPALDEYHAAVRIRDMKSAVAILLPLAEQGNAEACYQLASLYRSGNGVPADHRAAFQWLGKAAGQGHIQAMYNLGVMYENGWGTTADTRAARDWYQRAAQQGHRMASRKLDQFQTVTGQKQSSAVLDEALRRAVIRNDVAEIRRLLANDADVDSTDNNGKSVLMDAAEQGYPESFILLLKQTRSVNARDRHGDSALLFAVREGNREIVQTLLSAGANADLADHDGNTVVMAAASRNQLEI